ncbi:MAG: translocase [Anaerolineaceae bacterium 4572_78]|nr:MAG: translocase [Anaerolineaceae bacterium 4572_78]
MTTNKKKTSGFAKDVLKLVTGTTFAQVLAVLASPILTRLYNPDAFGIVALFASIVSIVSIISCMRYQLTIMLPDSDEEAANLFAVSVIFVIITTLTTIPVIWLGQKAIPYWLNEPKIGFYLWLIPISVFLSGLFLALNYWNSRTKHFGRLSVTQVIRSTGQVGGKLGAGFAGYATGGSMIGANVFGQAIATIVLGGQIWHDDSLLIRSSITWQKIWEGIKRYKEFPLYGTWSALLNTISWQLPVFFLASFFSATVVGYYALGTRLLRLPMSLIGGSIGQVFFQRAAVAKNEGTLHIVVENVFRQLVKIGLYPSLMLMLVGEDLFILVFGSNWAEAGVYVQILSIWTFFWFISSPLSTLFSVLERQDISLYINIAIFLSRLLALGIGGYFGNARLALILFGGSGILVYGYLSVLIVNLSGVSWKAIVQILFSNLIFFLPSGGIIIILIMFYLPAWLIVVATGILTTIYFFYILATDPQLFQLLERMGVVHKIKKYLPKL